MDQSFKVSENKNIKPICLIILKSGILIVMNNQRWEGLNYIMYIQSSGLYVRCQHQVHVLKSWAFIGQAILGDGSNFRRNGLTRYSSSLKS